ncbi:MAG: NAD-dependent DNA ligase LigA, partial [bacterium]|nr:NAD-dependent DNA ligase LigA [bacterium]
MDNNVQHELEKLRIEINRYDYLYYVAGRPAISDPEYDELYRRLLDIEREYPELVTLDSPSQRVGGAPVDDFPTINHSPPMLSLDNTYNEIGLREYDERVKRVLDVDSVAYSCEPKIDGVAISLIYE